MKRLGLIGPGKVGRSIVQALPRDRYPLGPVRGKGPSAARRLVRDLHDGRVVSSAGMPPVLRGKNNREECIYEWDE